MNLSLIVAAEVSLIWNPSPDADNYRVYVGLQSLTAGNEPVQTYLVNAPEFEVTGLTYGTRYFFAVKALAAGLESAFSNEVSWMPMPADDAPTISLFPELAVPERTDGWNDLPVELGLRFITDVSGLVTGVRFYKLPRNTGLHVANVWNAAGVRLGSANFVNETASGWQTALFTPPVVVTGGMTYTVSYFCRSGHYTADWYYFTGKGKDNGPLHALAGVNGTFKYGPVSAYPDQTYRDSNYWVDVLFKP